MEATPDIAGFIDAQRRFQSKFAREVTFTFLGDVTFPPGTPTDPETGKPYDPTVAGASAASTEVTIPALVVTEGFITPGSRRPIGEMVATAIGQIETGQMGLVIDAADWQPELADADHVEVFGESFEIDRHDEDAIANEPPHRHIVIIQQR